MEGGEEYWRSDKFITAIYSSVVTYASATFVLPPTTLQVDI